VPSTIGVFHLEDQFVDERDSSSPPSAGASATSSSVM
jgi:hypothetical protein